ncbi:MAG: hypothetical protein HRT64_06425 [Erythrobacter sp.]|nr:hypothetical protein [Erythrobacter sp.]
MSWALNKSALTSVALAGMALTGLVGASAARAEPAIVVKSTMSEYPVGSKIDDEATITLGSGDTLSVFTRRGSRSMRGPGTFVVGANPKSNRSRFTNLKRRRASTRSEAGAVRGSAPVGSERVARPNLFSVDVERSGRVCLSGTQDVVLWRGSTGQAATYLVNGPGLTAPVAVGFDSQTETAPPEEQPLALTGGVTYTIIGGQAGESPTLTTASVTIIDLGQDYARADQLAQAFVDNGCMAQFEIMGDRLVADN